VAQALRREHDGFFAEKTVRKAGLSLQVRLSLMMGAVTAAVLVLSIGAVLDRQYRAMEQMALTSATSIATFVSKNVALRVVDNATLPETQQDWMPVQAFVANAAQDTNVSDIVMIDAHGKIRASRESGRLGKRYIPPSDGKLVERGQMQRIYLTHDGSFRIDRDIAYAGAKVGSVTLVLDNKNLNAAARASRTLLFALGLAVLLVVVSGSYTIARVLARPIRRLKDALTDAAEGRLEFRISHNRTDEFGQLYDRFNDLIATIEARGDPSGCAAEAASLDATRVEPADRQASALDASERVRRLRA
jgi:serine/threonine-protein kinase